MGKFRKGKILVIAILMIITSFFAFAGKANATTVRRLDYDVHSLLEQTDCPSDLNITLIAEGKDITSVFDNNAFMANESCTKLLLPSTGKFGDFGSYIVDKKVGKNEVKYGIQGWYDNPEFNGDPVDFINFNPKNPVHRTFYAKMAPTMDSLYLDGYDMNGYTVLGKTYDVTAFNRYYTYGYSKDNTEHLYNNSKSKFYDVSSDFENNNQFFKIVPDDNTDILIDHTGLYAIADLDTCESYQNMTLCWDKLFNATGSEHGSVLHISDVISHERYYEIVDIIDETGKSYGLSITATPENANKHFYTVIKGSEVCRDVEVNDDMYVMINRDRLKRSGDYEPDLITVKSITTSTYNPNSTRLNENGELVGYNTCTTDNVSIKVRYNIDPSLIETEKVTVYFENGDHDLVDKGSTYTLPSSIPDKSADVENVRFKYQDGTTSDTTQPYTISYTPSKFVINDVRYEPSSKLVINEDTNVFYLYDETITGDNLPTPTRLHYNFVGWYTAPVGGELVSTFNKAIEAKTLYAHWVEKDKVTVVRTDGITITLDKGSEFTMPDIPFKRDETISKVKLIYNDGTDTESYEFVVRHYEGLNIYCNETGEYYNVGQTIVVNQNMTLTGNYEIKDNGPTLYDINPERENYTFEGWFTEPDGGYRVSLYTGADDLILYGHWSSDTENVIIRYRTNPETSGASWEEEDVVLKDSTYTLRDMHDWNEYNYVTFDYDDGITPQFRDNYVLRKRIPVGWYIDGTIYEPNTEIIADRNMNVIGEYVDTISPVEFPEDPVRPGYKFMGWFTEKDGKGTGYKNYDKPQSVILYAYWVLDSEYTLPTIPAKNPETISTVTLKFKDDLTSDKKKYVKKNYTAIDYTVNGGGYDNEHFNVGDKIVMAEGVTITPNYEEEIIGVDLYSATRDGYMFAGWYDEEDGGNRYYNYSGDEDITLYAHWTTDAVSDICRRATTLHTNGKKTYGNLGTPGTLVPGDAFDCDVNGDGVYDPETERFYYINDLWDAETDTFVESVASLVYYADYYGGPLSSSSKEGFVKYGSTLPNDGPNVAAKILPTTEEWSNVSLYKTVRQLSWPNNSKTNSAGNLGTYDYTGYSARMIHGMELFQSGCLYSYNNKILAQYYNLNNSCEFLTENTRKAPNGRGEYAYWIESPGGHCPSGYCPPNRPSPDFNKYGWELVTQSSNEFSSYLYQAQIEWSRGVRPVIDVPKTSMQDVPEHTIYHTITYPEGQEQVSLHGSTFVFGDVNPGTTTTNGAKVTFKYQDDETGDLVLNIKVQSTPVAYRIGNTRYDKGSELIVLDDYQLEYETVETITGIKFLSDPTREGYSFLGWYDSPAGGNKYESYNENKELTLYAHWSKNLPELPVNTETKDDEIIGTVTYKLHNGEDDITTNVVAHYVPNGWLVNGVWYSAGSKVDLTGKNVEPYYSRIIRNADVPSNPTKTGYEFTGWYTEETGGNPVYYVNTEGNHTVHAQYTDSYAIFDTGMKFLWKVQEFNLTNYDLRKATESEYNSATLTDTNIISTTNSPYPIYVWALNNNIIVYYSEADVIFMNPDGTYMFSDTKIKSADAHEINTIKTTDMAHMFHRAPSLESVNISGWNTSNVTDMSLLFCEDSKLANGVDVSHFNTSKVTDMSSMFSQLKLIEELDVSNFDTRNVRDMGGMFDYNTALRELDLSNFDTSKVREFDRMFDQDKALTRLDLRNFETSSATNMSYMFWGANNLTELNVTSFDTSNVTNFQGMFGGIGVYELDLSSFDTSSIGNYGAKEMLIGLLNCKTIYVSDKWDISNSDPDNRYSVFLQDYRLIGQKGTRYSHDHLYSDYAIVDDAPDHPGYLTLKGYEPGEIIIPEPDGIVCKRAKTLHTYTCDSNGYYCPSLGYDSGDTITYGNLGIDGELNPGDAFTCDVNGDGEFDEEHERFYYVSDYYDTETKEYDSNYAALIYYTALGSGKPYTLDYYETELSEITTILGPENIAEDLPSTDTWTNVSLKNTSRQIYAARGNNFNIETDQFTYFSEGAGVELTNNVYYESFDYSVYGARFLDIHELSAATGIKNFSIGTRISGSGNEYLFESRTGYYLENPYDAYKAWDINNGLMEADADSVAYAVPVIDVNKDNIELISKPVTHTITYPNLTVEEVEDGAEWIFPVNNDVRENEAGATVTFDYQNGDDNTTTYVIKQFLPSGWKIDNKHYNDGQMIIIDRDIVLEYDYIETGIIEFPEDPTREGYTFTGWYTAPAGGDKITSYTGKENITLYAHWNGETEVGPSYLCRRSVATVESEAGQVFGNDSFTEGEYHPGDIFICDVNGDGTYDEDTERFYYVSDYYDTETGEFDEDYAALFYFTSINGDQLELLPYSYYDESTDYYGIEYSTNDTTANGPETLMDRLPSTSKWSNVTLKTTTRKIVNADGNEYGTADYSGKAARLLTLQEIMHSCNGTLRTRTDRDFALNDSNCDFLLHNAGHLVEWEESEFGSEPWVLRSNFYWLETAQSETKAYYSYIGNTDSTIDTTYFPIVTGANISARPVIDVPKSQLSDSTEDPDSSIYSVTYPDGTVELYPGGTEIVIPSTPDNTEITAKVRFKYNNGNSDTTSTVSKLITYNGISIDGTTYSPKSIYVLNKDIVMEYDKTESNTPAVFPSDPARDGYEFTGWYDSDNQVGGNKYTEYDGDEDLVLYARWLRTDTSNVLCKKATNLHTINCDNTNSYCKDNNVTSITFGKIAAGNKYTAGDAFDCDVNGDGVFDEEYERFYYVNDYYDTHTKKFNSNYAALVSAYNYIDGPTTGGHNYNLDGLNVDGPSSRIYLPSTSDWSNITLLESNRVIRIKPDSYHPDAYPEFDYEGRAARLLTFEEVRKGCGVGVSTPGYLDNCLFLLENTTFGKDEQDISGSIMTDLDKYSSVYLENNNVEYSDTYVFALDSDTRAVNTKMVSSWYGGIRPTIDVPKERLGESDVTYTITYPDETTEVVPAGSSFTFPRNNSTKDELHSATITFKYNDGITEDYITYVGTSYIASGWKIGTAHYDDGETYIINSDITLAYDYAETESSAIFPINPTRNGYTFKGWYDSLAGGDKYTSYEENKDITLYARWERNECTNPEEYTLGTNDIAKADEVIGTVTFKYHNGNADTTSNVVKRYTPNGWLVDGEFYKDGETITRCDSTVIEPYYIENIVSAIFPSIPEKDNLKFTGWFTEEVGGTSVAVLNKAGDTIVHAQYTDDYAIYAHGDDHHGELLYILKNYNKNDIVYRQGTREEYLSAVNSGKSISDVSFVGTSVIPKSPKPIYLWLSGNEVLFYSEASVIYAFTDTLEMFGENTKLKEVDLTGINFALTEKTQAMFDGDSNLTKITFGDDFVTYNVIDMSWMFSGCSSLTNLDLSHFDTSKVGTEDDMDFYGMFSQCSSLTELDLSTFNTSNATNMGRMFHECKSLTELDLSSFDTSNVTNMEEMFRTEFKLKTIYVSNKWDNSNVTSSNNMFSADIKIVGQNGTTYDENHVDASYAIIDNAPENPGYLTLKGGTKTIKYTITYPDGSTEVVPAGTEFKFPSNVPEKDNENVAEVTFKPENDTESIVRYVTKSFTLPGWKIEDTRYEIGDTYIVNSDITLSYDYIDAINGVEFPEDPTLGGDIFLGWYDAKIEGNKVTSYNGIEDITFYAHWQNGGIPSTDALCIRAKHLHKFTFTGSLWDNELQDLVQNTENVTYGNYGTNNRDIHVGDAFTCDVNGDGIYDEETERFYYVNDFYDASTDSFDSDYAALIYYTNFYDNHPSAEIGDSINYSVNRYTNEGPTYASSELPTSDVWPNVSLYKVERKIVSPEGITYNDAGPFPEAFSYDGYAARLLTVQEVINSPCYSGEYSPDTTGAGDSYTIDGYMCSFLSENTQELPSDNYYEDPPGFEGQYWLENPMASNNKINHKGMAYANRGHWIHGDNNFTTSGVRPVIDVPKSDLDLTIHPRYNISIDSTKVDELPIGDEYTVIDDQTDKDGGNIATVTFMVNDEVYSRSYVTNTYTPNGYTFNGKHYNAGDKIKVTEDIDLTSDYIETIIPAEFPEDPVDEGFAGWYDGHNKDYFIDSYDGDEDITLYAYFDNDANMCSVTFDDGEVLLVECDTDLDLPTDSIEIEDRTLTFNYNDGVTPNETRTYTVTKTLYGYGYKDDEFTGDSISIRVSKDMYLRKIYNSPEYSGEFPEVSNESFIGWFDSLTDGKTYKDYKEYRESNTDVTTLYAHYEETGKASVILDGEVVAVVNIGDTYTMPSGADLDYVEIGVVTLVNGNDISTVPITRYAEFDHFDVDGTSYNTGDDITVNDTVYIYSIYANESIEAYLPRLHDTEYQFFDGWYTEQDGKGTKYYDTYDEKVSVTLYSYFVGKNVLVDYYADKEKQYNLDWSSHYYGDVVDTSNITDSRDYPGNGIITFDYNNGTGYTGWDQIYVTKEIDHWVDDNDKVYNIVYTVDFGTDKNLYAVYNNNLVVNIQLSDLDSSVNPGYDFTGWYTKPVGGTRVTSINEDKNITVYAHWKRNDDNICRYSTGETEDCQLGETLTVPDSRESVASKVTEIINGNGEYKNLIYGILEVYSTDIVDYYLINGTKYYPGDEYTIEENPYVEVHYGGSYIEPVELDEVDDMNTEIYFGDQNHKFIGWSTSRNGGNIYTHYAGNQDITLYGQYYDSSVVTDTVGIEIERLDGSTIEREVPRGTSLYLSDEITDTVRFTLDDTINEYKERAIITDIAGAFTVNDTAVKAGKYVVTDSVQIKPIVTETNISYAPSIPTPTREGYTFSGWLDSDSMAIDFDSLTRAQVIELEGQTINGQWYENNPDMVIVDLDGTINQIPKGFELVLPSESMKRDDEFNLIIADTKSSQTAEIEMERHYTVKGYLINGVFYEPGITYVFNEDTVMRTQYNIEVSYPDNIAQQMGITWPELPTLPDDDFKGWYDAPAGGNKVEDGSNIFDETTLYARYTQQYRLTVDGNTSYVKDGYIYTVPSFGDIRGDSISLTLDYQYDDITKNITIGYGKPVSYQIINGTNYEPGEIYIVNEDTDVESITSGNESELVMVPEVDTPTREGYRFIGWLTKEQWKGTLYQSDNIDIYKLTPKDKIYDGKTLYAFWKSEDDIEDDEVNVTLKDEFRRLNFTNTMKIGTTIDLDYIVGLDLYPLANENIVKSTSLDVVDNIENTYDTLNIRTEANIDHYIVNGQRCEVGDSYTIEGGTTIEVIRNVTTERTIEGRWKDVVFQEPNTPFEDYIYLGAYDNEDGNGTPIDVANLEMPGDYFSYRDGAQGLSYNTLYIKFVSNEDYISLTVDDEVSVIPKGMGTIPDAKDKDSEKYAIRYDYNNSSNKVVTDYITVNYEFDHYYVLGKGEYAPGTSYNYLEDTVMNSVYNREIIYPEMRTIKTENFVGWYTEPHGGEEVTTLEGINKDTTLYARYNNEHVTIMIEGAIYTVPFGEEFEFPDWEDSHRSIDVVLNYDDNTSTFTTISSDLTFNSFEYDSVKYYPGDTYLFTEDAEVKVNYDDETTFSPEYVEPESTDTKLFVEWQDMNGNPVDVPNLTGNDSEYHRTTISAIYEDIDPEEDVVITYDGETIVVPKGTLLSELGDSPIKPSDETFTVYIDRNNGTFIIDTYEITKSYDLDKVYINGEELTEDDYTFEENATVTTTYTASYEPNIFEGLTSDISGIFTEATGGVRVENYDNVNDGDTLYYQYGETHTITVDGEVIATIPHGTVYTLPVNTKAKNAENIATVTFDYGYDKDPYITYARKRFNPNGWSIDSEAYANNEKITVNEDIVLEREYYETIQGIEFPGTPKRSGYRFNGWYYNDEEITSYDGTDDITITADWIKQIIITYLDDGTTEIVDAGTTKVFEPADDTEEVFHNITFKYNYEGSPEDKVVRISSHGKYNGWIINNTDEYNPGEEITFNEDSTVEARYEEVISNKNLPEDPVREGYDFLGWYNGKNLETSSKVDITKINKDMTVYGQYKVTGEYVVFFDGEKYTYNDEGNINTFDLGYASEESETRYDVTLDYQDKVTPNRVIPTSITNTFVKWTDENDNEYSEVINLTYDLDGMHFTSHYDEDEFENLDLSTYNPDNNNFIGWYTDRNNGELVTIITEPKNITLYAHYQDTEIAIITVDNEVEIYNVGDTYILPSDKTKEDDEIVITFDPQNGEDVFTKTITTSYTFNGYRLDTDNTLYDGEQSFTVEGNMTFNSEFSSNTTGDTWPSNPEKENYIFLGWYTNETTGVEVFNFDGITSNTSLYAHYTTNDESFVTLTNTVTGESLKVAKNTDWVFGDSKFNKDKKDKLGTITYKFNSTGYPDEEIDYYRNSTITGYYIEGDDTLYSTSDINQFTTDTNITPEYNVETDTHVGLDQFDYEVTNGEKRVRCFSKTNQTDPNDEEEYTCYTEYNPEDGDVTLYLHWRDIVKITVTEPNGITKEYESGDIYNTGVNDSTKDSEDYTVTFKYQDGREDTTQSHMTTYTANGWLINGNHVDDNTDITLEEDIVKEYDYSVDTSTITLPEPTRDGYTFKGWNSKSDGKGITYDNDTINSLNKDTIVYGIWTKDEIVVSFNSHGGSDIGDITYAYDEEYGDLPVPTYDDNHVFDGWYKEDTYENKVSSKTKATEDIELHAKWIEETFPFVYPVQIEPLVCDGSNYVNTGVMLYDDTNWQKDYEIGFTIDEYDSDANETQAVFANTKYEVESLGWPGLTFRKVASKLEITQNINGTKKNVTFGDYAPGYKVRIMRINKTVYYQINDGQVKSLQSMSNFNQQFELPVYFCAGDNGSGGTQRHLKGTISNYYVRRGTYEDLETHTVTYPDGTVETYIHGSVLDLESNESTKASEVVSTVTFKPENGENDIESTVVKNYTPNGFMINGVHYDDESSLVVDEDKVITYSYNEDIDEAIFPDDPEKEHYDFDGWFDGDTEYTEYSGDTDITLTAEYTRRTITITLPDEPPVVINEGDSYDLSENTEAKLDDNIAEVTFKYHDDETEDLVRYVTKSYTPNGWIIDGVHYDDYASITPTKDITVIPDYIETINGAEFPSNPSRDNYEFMGWFTEETSGEKVTSYDGENDIILHAQWDMILPTDFDIDSDDVLMVKGETHQIEVTFIPDGTSDTISYTSSDDNIATVSSDGLITAVDKGVITIIVSLDNVDVEKIITVTVVSDKLESETYDVLDKEKEEEPDDRIVIGAEPGTTIQEFKENMLNPVNYIKIYDGDTELSEDDIVKTGLTIKLEINGIVHDEAIIIIRGDINEDGLVNVIDKSLLSEHVLRLNNIEGYRSYAADVDNNDSINITDKSKLSEYILRLIDSLNN